MKKILILVLTLSFQLTFAQKTYQTYTSSNYNYSIEYRSDFIKRDIIGKNIDFKVADDNGNSIIVIVKKLLPQERNMTTDDMLNIPNEYWEANLQLPKVKVIKKGIVYVDSIKGMFLHYSSTELDDSYTLYYTNYFFVVSGYLYHITATCDLVDLSKMQPIFFRALHSFTFPN